MLLAGNGRLSEQPLRTAQPSLVPSDELQGDYERETKVWVCVEVFPERTKKPRQMPVKIKCVRPEIRTGNETTTSRAGAQEAPRLCCPFRVFFNIYHGAVVKSQRSVSVQEADTWRQFAYFRSKNSQECYNRVSKIHGLETATTLVTHGAVRLRSAMRHARTEPAVGERATAGCHLCPKLVPRNAAVNTPKPQQLMAE